MAKLGTASRGRGGGGISGINLVQGMEKVYLYMYKPIKEDDKNCSLFLFRGNRLKIINSQILDH